MIKIDPVELQRRFGKDKTDHVTQHLGDWATGGGAAALAASFVVAAPFDHVVIPHFLEAGYAEQLHTSFLTVGPGWHVYCNPLEVKHAFDDLERMPDALRDYFYILSSPTLTELVGTITGISELEPDPYLHGAGLHAHSRDGRLNMHLDYETHPISQKRRRINVILYLTKNWEDAWNGLPELWDSAMNGCVTRLPIRFNTAVVFRTSDTSWHGVPEIIECPEGVVRKSLAYYYVSEFTQGSAGHRSKAEFVRRPSDPVDARMDELYAIRSSRRIEVNDMLRIWPEWTPSWRPPVSLTATTKSILGLLGVTEEPVDESRSDLLCNVNMETTP